MQRMISSDPSSEIMSRHQDSPDGKPRLHLVFESEEVPGLKKLLDRSLNTLDPSLWPAFARELDDFCEVFITTHPTVAP